jgi:hypothetical protein
MDNFKQYSDTDAGARLALAGPTLTNPPSPHKLFFSVQARATARVFIISPGVAQELDSAWLAIINKGMQG